MSSGDGTFDYDDFGSAHRSCRMNRFIKESLPHSDEGHMKGTLEVSLCIHSAFVMLT